MDLVYRGRVYRLSGSDVPRIRSGGLEAIKSSRFVDKGGGYRDTEFSFPDLSSALDWMELLRERGARSHKGLPLWRVRITGRKKGKPRLLTNPIRYGYSGGPVPEPFVYEAVELLKEVPKPTASEIGFRDMVDLLDKEV